MITRRGVLQAAAGIAALSASGHRRPCQTGRRPTRSSSSPPFQTRTPPASSAATNRSVQYLAKQLGVPVKLRIANDYAAVIEGQIAGNIHIAQYGPAAYARAYMNGAKIEPFGMQVNKDGTKGYYSVLWVKADSPTRSSRTSRARTSALSIPNSTSGNNVPRFAMNKMGIKPEEFFSNVVYAGSHENAIIALQQGQVDARLQLVE